MSCQPNDSREHAAECKSWFLIKSAGTLDPERGFLPAENSLFDPDAVTALLGIQPFRTVRAGAEREHRRGRYPFSAWYGCLQTEPDVSRLTHCSRIAQALTPYIPALQQLRQQYDLSFCIEITVYGPEKGGGDVIGMTLDVMEFCCAVGAEISVDTFCYSEYDV